MIPVHFGSLQRTFRQVIRARFDPSLLQKSPKQKHDKMERVESLTSPDEFDSLSPTFTALGLRDEKSVTAFLDRMRPSERTLIYDIINRKKSLQYEPPKVPVQIPVHYDELRSVWWTNYVPYLVYGFIDMLTMIVAGEWFDKVIGLQMGFSPMGGAAVGNLVSNGLGLAVVHYSAMYVVHIRKPKLLPGQEEEWTVHWVQHCARVLGLVGGCVLGMFPLLFFESPDRPPPVRLHEVDESEEVNAELERRETCTQHRDPTTDERRRHVFHENFHREYEGFKRNWSELLGPTADYVGDGDDNEEQRTTTINERVERNSDGTPTRPLVRELEDQIG